MKTKKRPVTVPAYAGLISLKTQAAPAAGAEQVFTVPAGHLYNVIAIRQSITTSATVANRTISITFDNGTTNFYFTPLTPNVTAGLTRTLLLIPGIANETAFDTAAAIRFSMPPLWLPAGFRISTGTGSLQATDQYAIMYILCEDWLV